MNHDNIISKVPRISLQESVSKKTGNPYVMLTIHFANGYRLRTLVNDDQKFGIKDALNTKSTDSMLDQVD